MDERSRSVQWLKFAGFLGVGVIVLVVFYAMAEDSDGYRPEPVETADHLLTVTTSRGVDAIEGSACLAIPEAGDLVQMTPDLFFVQVRDGRSKAESVAACLRDSLAADVKLAAL